jgi:hypothetical protein
MRYPLVAAVICGSTLIAKGEEAYLKTAGQLSTCIGLEIRSLLGKKVITPEALDGLLTQKCGFLEEREEDEFFNFISGRLFDRTLTETERAEAMARIIAEILVSHTRGGMRRTVVEAYRATITHKQAPPVKPAPAIPPRQPQP